MTKTYNQSAYGLDDGEQAEFLRVSIKSYSRLSLRSLFHINLG